MNPQTATTDRIAEARAALDEHVRRIVTHHFSPETGCPFWLDWAGKAGWDPRRDIRSYDDLMKFPHFEDAWLRDLPHEVWIPAAYRGRPFHIFETGGTTGLPKQRISWEDHRFDYTEFSDHLSDDDFPRGGNWLMLGPTGPRRLRLAIEHLANVRGGACYHIDLDPRWVKRLLAEGQTDQARRYTDHVIDQAVAIVKHRDVRCLFATPRLLEALGDRIHLPNAGIRGVFCGGTSMTPQVIRFLCEEVLDNRARLVPTYGNTLMGLAIGEPVDADHGYDLIYHAPQPRAVLRVVDPDQTDRTVDYGRWGRVELSTLTEEFFMPRFLERDEAMRCPPHELYPWDGVGNVRPFQSQTRQTIEGVY